MFNSCPSLAALANFSRSSGIAVRVPGFHLFVGFISSSFAFVAFEHSFKHPTSFIAFLSFEHSFIATFASFIATFHSFMAFIASAFIATFAAFNATFHSFMAFIAFLPFEHSATSIAFLTFEHFRCLPTFIAFAALHFIAAIAMSAGDVSMLAKDGYR